MFSEDQMPRQGAACRKGSRDLVRTSLMYSNGLCPHFFIQPTGVRIQVVKLLSPWLARRPAARSPRLGFKELGEAGKAS